MILMLVSYILKFLHHLFGIKMVPIVQSTPWIFSRLTLNNSHLNSINLGHSLGLSIFATFSMAYRVLLIVPMYRPNWLLVLPPKNGLNTCSVSIQVFWSISIGLIWSSRFKIMVNSNLNLHHLRFMIYQLLFIPGMIMVKIIPLVCWTP
jgi:hypothetical protein